MSCCSFGCDVAGDDGSVHLLRERLHQRLKAGIEFPERGGRLWPGDQIDLGPLAAVRLHDLCIRSRHADDVRTATGLA